MGLRDAFQQLRFLAYEVKRMNGAQPSRWLTVWSTDGFRAVASYRLSGSAYLALGRGWPALRAALSPALYALRPWSGGCEIHYTADIGPGLKVLHPTLGVVISGKAMAGKHLVLVGGNCIGARIGTRDGEIVLGDDVTLGANAVVLGPVTVGDRVQIGACAVVSKDLPDDVVAVGAPARPVGAVRSPEEEAELRRRAGR